MLNRILVLVLLFVSCIASADVITFDNWSCTGNCGVSDSDGVVISDNYWWVSTLSGVQGAGLKLGRSEKTASNLRSDMFTVTAGQQLSFDYNFITSDGVWFSDYVWVRLLNEKLNPAGMIRTGRAYNATYKDDDSLHTRPGTAWSPLGPDSGYCYGSGCGNTGWINVEYEFHKSGDYILEFGVANWLDCAYQSGLAFTNVKVFDEYAKTESVPEPNTLLLCVLATALLFYFRNNND